MRVETEKNFKWLIDANSVEKRITELQQAITFTKKPYQDTSSHVETNNETQSDMSRHDELPVYQTSNDAEIEILRQQREELETEVMHLRINHAAKEQVINRMVAERKEFMAQMQDMSYRLGQATAKLEMLEAPRPEPKLDMSRHLTRQWRDSLKPSRLRRRLHPSLPKVGSSGGCWARSTHVSPQAPCGRRAGGVVKS